MKKQTLIWQDKTLYIILYTFLTLTLIVCAYPLILVISNSFSSPAAVTSGKVWLLPVNPSLEGYIAVFRDSTIVSGYVMSLFYMVVGTLINVFVTIICAYPLSVKTLPGKQWIMFLFTFTMFFSGGMIPSYLTVYQLGMIDTIWAMIIPGALSVWNMILMRTYFMSSIPGELREAARIDGCSDILYMLRILLPLSGPIIAVVTLYYAVGHWNSYFNAMLYLRDNSLYPLQMVLRRILVINTVSMDMLSGNADTIALQTQLVDIIKYAVIVVASAPLCIMYPFVQKHFVKGMMVGSLKG